MTDDSPTTTAAQTTNRREILRALAGVAAAGALGVYSISPAEATPSGTFPGETDDPLLKLRADRARLVARTSTPTAPSSGRALLYVRDGDLP